jgi:hypothetical protein
MFDLLGAHHVAVYPSLWECWPFVALHAFDRNRPVVATPTGGFVEMVSSECGWLTHDTSADALERTLRQVLDSRENIRRLVDAGQPRQALERLANTEAVSQRYLELARTAGGSRPARLLAAEVPLVSVIVPYFQMEAFVAETLRSIFDQTHTRLEVIVVNDGSLRDEDTRLFELGTEYPITVLTQQNSGLGAARNFGISQARGRFVFPLDPDDMVLPTFVERCVDVLENDPDVAYVTSWVRFVDESGEPHPAPFEGYEPLANDVSALKELNVAGSSAVVIRRRVFDLGHWYSIDSAASYEDWLFYRQLERSGFHGHAIPERLILYRIRQRSMLREVGTRHHDRLVGEMEAHLRAEEMQWTRSNA